MNEDNLDKLLQKVRDNKFDFLHATFQLGHLRAQNELFTKIDSLNRK